MREIFPLSLANGVNRLVHAHSFVYLICNPLEKYFLYFSPNVVWFGYCLMFRLTIFQPCWDGATASWVFTSTLESLKRLAQGHYTAVVGFEPWTSHSGVRRSTTEPPRPLTKGGLIFNSCSTQLSIEYLMAHK